MADTLFDASALTIDASASPSNIPSDLLRPNPMDGTNRAWLSPDGTWHPTDLHENVALHLDDEYVRSYRLFDHGYARIWCWPGREMGVQTPAPLTRAQFGALHALLKAAQPGWLVTDRGRYDASSLARMTTCQRDEQGEREWDERYRMFRTALGTLAT